MVDFKSRLERFLTDRGRPIDIKQLTPDASTREYFRIMWKDSTAIACVYPEAFVAAEQSYLDVTNLFRVNGLPVAEILDVDEALGVIVQEDFGDTILRDVITKAGENERERLIDDAIRLIPRIQAATQSAFDLNSIASRSRFDTEKLSWELDFFKEHYFTTFKKEPLPPDIDAKLTAEFVKLSYELEGLASVLCHRDFHAANLMVGKAGNLRIIDHQDARIGSAAYDLVSFLLDRVTEPPSVEWLAEKRRLFLNERESLDLPKLDTGAFTYEFRLQTVQRCLKAVGTFSYQSVNRGKTYFIPFIRPMFEIVLRAAKNLDRFPVLTNVLENELGS
jgi:aminoglycoside/choline kinase family phosphotransferase